MNTICWSCGTVLALGATKCENGVMEAGVMRLCSSCKRLENKDN